ncbi:MAG: hypothetical protein AVDCRST_MAG87-210 [uncultured Thermomicrobiales bacterium]|uniref:Uncharacterized protein n=1 Tax=uncultured Thermomicrobiales bacterium TaxID=1645740 RepID=A0A6J4UAQ1_9BACT|nr:MAG: hypothetical protein AVDCRST_MAG87-210 [uncultured Thermomicrobiales bacterium]
MRFRRGEPGSPVTVRCWREREALDHLVVGAVALKMAAHKLDFRYRDRERVAVRHRAGFGGPLEPGADRLGQITDAGAVGAAHASERDMWMELALFERELVFGQGRADRVPQSVQPVSRSVEPEPDHPGTLQLREDAEICRPQRERFVPGDDLRQGQAQDLGPLGFNLAEEVQRDVGVSRSGPAHRPALLLEIGDGPVHQGDYVGRQWHGEEEAQRSDRRSFLRPFFGECRLWWAAGALGHVPSIRDRRGILSHGDGCVAVRG